MLTFSSPSKMEMKPDSSPPPSPPVPVGHVLIFPLPAQGHVNSMLKLAELLTLSSRLHVTFLNTDVNQNRLFQYTDIQTRFAEYPNFRFRTIPDGLPPDYSRSDDKVTDILYCLISNTLPILKDMLVARDFSSDGLFPAVSCIIADGILSSAINMAEEVGIPIIHFRTISACSFWAYFSIPAMIQASDLPIKGDEDMDRPITSIPAMEKIMRLRDLPSFCRSAINLDDKGLQIVLNATQQTRRAKALILNTFDELESPIVAQIRAHCPNIYTVGPLHAHLRTRLNSGQSPTSSLREVDRTCLRWLDSQPSKSVLYVSFGSIAILTNQQLLEFCHGLINSGKRFLWVMRPGSVSEKEPKEAEELALLLEKTKELGYIVGWAPQEEVLSHPAVGGFLTHSGWNSTLESLGSGVPMLCWPYFADQQVNSRFVSEVWGSGLDMKDVCERGVVEKMVNDLMVDRRAKFQKRAADVAEMALRSVSPGGSSFCNLDRLIEDIRLMSV